MVSTRSHLRGGPRRIQMGWISHSLHRVQHPTAHGKVCSRSRQWNDPLVGTVSPVGPEQEGGVSGGRSGGGAGVMASWRIPD